MAHSSKRLDGVDILRGLAILFVLMNHVNMRLVLEKIPYAEGLPSQLVSSLVWNGQYGVQMFYIVFPLICRLLGRGKRLITLLLVVIILGPFGRTVLAHGNDVWREYSYLGGMDAVALGCLTAMALSRTRLARAVLWMVSGIGTALLIFSLGFSNQADAWGLAQQRPRYDDRRRRKQYDHRRRCSVEVEESAHYLSTRKARPTQLRSLSDAYVRCTHGVFRTCLWRREDLNSWSNVSD